jgi:hypothetical protein
LHVKNLASFLKSTFGIEKLEQRRTFQEKLVEQLISQSRGKALENANDYGVRWYSRKTDPPEHKFITCFIWPFLKIFQNFALPPKLFRKKRLALNEMFQQNASKFAISYV